MRLSQYINKWLLRILICFEKINTSLVEYYFDVLSNGTVHYFWYVFTGNNKTRRKSNKCPTIQEQNIFWLSSDNGKLVGETGKCKNILGYQAFCLFL